MKKTKLLSFVLAFFVMTASVGVFAEETQETTEKTTSQTAGYTTGQVPEETPPVTEGSESDKNPTEENKDSSDEGENENSQEGTDNLPPSESEDGGAEAEPDDETENSDEKAPASTDLMTEEMITLRDNIAEKIKAVEEGWTAMDMALYKKVENTSVKMSEETLKAITKAYIKEVTEKNTTVSDRARIEIVLKSIGINSRELYDGESQEPINNAKALQEGDVTSGGYYAAPWILLATLQGNVELSKEQKNSLLELLEQNSKGGTFGYSWGGMSFSDYDTASVVIAALSDMYEENERAKALVDEIVTSIEGAIGENGSFGSANTDAMVILGYLAIGKNPSELKHSESGNNVIDGIMTYVNKNKDGFTYANQDNYMATEQGFRALCALSLYNGEALNIYDFSDNQTVAGGEKPEIQVPEEIPPVIVQTPVYSGGGGYRKKDKEKEKQEEKQNEKVEEQQEENIEKVNVEFSDTKNHWGQNAISNIVSKGIMKGMDNACFAPDEKATRAQVVTMLYRLGGEEKLEKETKFFDVPDECWFKSAVSWASSKGIAMGIDKESFGPDGKVSREQLAVFLYRYAQNIGMDVAKEEIKANEEVSLWAKGAVSWAKEAGIIKGRENGEEDYSADVTRAEIATMFERFLILCGEQTK